MFSQTRSEYPASSIYFTAIVFLILGFLLGAELGFSHGDKRGYERGLKSGYQNGYVIGQETKKFK
jgi:hypothetical protein